MTEDNELVNGFERQALMHVRQSGLQCPACGTHLHPPGSCSFWTRVSLERAMRAGGWTCPECGTHTTGVRFGKMLSRPEMKEIAEQVFYWGAQWLQEQGVELEDELNGLHLSVMVTCRPDLKVALHLDHEGEERAVFDFDLDVSEMIATGRRRILCVGARRRRKKDKP